MRPYKGLVGALIAILMLHGPAGAADADLIRSELPFWGERSADAWPHSCGDDSRVAACTIFETGDWQRVDAGCAEPQSPSCRSWLRLHMAGVFHPHFSSVVADDREALKYPRPEVTFIGALRTETWPKLFSVQIGFRGGSQHLLVAVAAQTPNDPIKHVTVLDARCDESIPGVHRRKVSFETIFVNRYCAVDSPRALRQLALKALDRSPLATLDWFGEEPEEPPPPEPPK